MLGGGVDAEASARRGVRGVPGARADGPGGREQREAAAAARRAAGAARGALPLKRKPTIIKLK